LFTQAMPLSQSAFVVQVFVHAPLTHRKGWQLCTPGSRQVPRPSQVPAVFSWLPEHEGVRHCVSRG
jgi:hypothetical protein